MIYIYYMLAVLVSVLASLAQVNFKMGSLNINVKKPIAYNLKNKHLIIGIILFLLSPAISIFIMRVIDFSVFYTFTALNYFFIMLFSYKILNEKIGKLKIIGNSLIILGIIVFNI